MEEDFPRGGTHKSSVDKSVKSHEVDNLFQTQEPEVKKKRKTVKQDEGENFKKLKVDTRGLKLNTADCVEVLHLLNLKVGTLLLGCVREVSDMEAVVGLPSGLVGYLPIRNICDSYTKILIEQLDSLDSLEEVVTLSELLTPGTLVRCVVSSLNSVSEGQISLKLSINPKEVNKCLSPAALKPGMTLSGCVESVEDHGFLVDIGISGTKAFLPKKSTSSKQDLKVGQYVLSLIEEVKNEGRVVRLSLNPQAVNKSVAGTQQGWTLDSLLPGLLIRVQIKRVTPHGLVVEYLSSFSGTVDFLHIDQEKASSYKSGNEVLARVLYIEPSSRAVALSLRSHLLPPGGSVLDNFTSEQIGEVVQGCKMTALHHHSGALMELPDGTTAFVHRNRMKEPKEEFNPNRLVAMPEHNLRITDYSPMEQIQMASLRKSNIEAKFFRYQDVKVGQIIEATVISLQKPGVFVRVTDHIRGMIPRNHLADVVLTNPEKKFHEGMTVKCRVLSVDSANKRLLLTRKKALIESTLPIIQSYSDARVGRVAHGSIICVKKYGCIVRFYGEVKGLVPVQELSTEDVTDPEELFFVGQVVKAKVIKCNEESEKLVLSFKAVTEVDVIETQSAQFDFEIGKTVDVRVRRKVLDGLEVSILPEEIPAFLPTVHLSDHVTNCLLLWDALNEGDNISNVVCLNKNKRGINLTKKPSLMACLEDGNVPTGFSELQLGMQMVGWVKNIMPYGIFIDFPRGLFGLAPKAAMCEQFIKDTSNIFAIGQTVVAKVTNLDEEKNRFLVSLKVSELNLSEEDTHARLIQGQKERKAIIEMVTCRGESDLLEQLSSVSVGDKIKMVVEDVKEDGTVTLTSDQLSEAIVLASKHHTTGVNTTAGCKVTAVVLHVNPLKSQVLVSLLPTLTRKRKSLSKNSELSATIQYIDKDFAVVSLGDTGHLTVIPTKTQLNDVVDLESKKFSIGSCLNVIVKNPSSEELGGLPLVACKGQDQQVKSKSKESAQKHSLGAMVTAKVTKLKPLGVLVMLPSGTTGHIHVSEIEESPVVGSHPTSSLKIGAEVQAKVIGGHTVRGNRFLPVTHPDFKLALPELTILPRKLEDDSMQTVDKLKNYKPGDEVICFLSKYDKQLKCLEVHVKSNIMGTVELLAMISKPGQANNPQKLVKPGQAVLAKVVGNNPSRTGQLSLSLTGVYKVEQGSVTMGMVWKIEPHRGLFVKLPFGNSGLVSLMDLSDEYSDNPLEPYKEGQVIRCCIIGEEKGHFNVSLRPSRTNKGQQEKVTDPEIQSISDIKEGQIVRGYVKTVGVSGIFVRLSRSLEGRVQLQHASKYFINKPEMISKHVTQNALVTAKVLRVDTENIHVSLSLLTKDTGKPDILPESLKLHSRLPEDEKKKHNRTKRKRVSSESQQQDEKKEGKQVKEEHVDKKKAKKEDSDSGVEVFFREKDDDEPNKECEKKEPERLQISCNFSWDTTLSSLTPAAVDQVYESSEDEEEDQSKPVKKTRKELQQEQQNAEQQLSKLEAELMDPSVRPDNTTAFERLLLSSPDSSFLWLQYMAFHLQATQIEQARAVAERALKTISFREEQEKLNVWVAMLNLENMYGTEESLQKVFERAIQYCEPLPVYQQLADIYAKSDKLKEAESLYKSMVKRFRQEKAVYESYGSFLLRQGQSNAANALLQRALQSLSNKDHVDLITKFARLEFQYGNTERAKSMFDKVLGTYSKRTDLWSVFIDLMVKHGSQKEVREIFDRVIHLSVSVKKIKFFFKRYLDYERKHGTPESIQAVKQKALEYVECKGAEASS
ncbi:protein RRP5 homolog [Triplophysa dalaica]|uniref:protein RRP5 homolog n=1 Tax=Triplophysa dalaica TaxID=1582913 RepID=UPI0024DF929A|nr:protein RRP5 homolog [Triplophysa dalaica]XP_056628231.1 protein RRP5 homolog [Triplophysa dalaica]